MFPIVCAPDFCFENSVLGSANMYSNSLPIRRLILEACSQGLIFVTAAVVGATASHGAAVVFVDDRAKLQKKKKI